MKKSTLALAAGIGMLAFAACSKSDNGSSAQAAYVGAWKLHEQVIDTNNNGKMDASDEVDIRDSIDYILQLNSNNKGTYTVYGLVDSITWKLANNDAYMEISYTSGPAYFLITAQSSSSFTIEDTTEHPIRWEIFEKQ